MTIYNAADFLVERKRFKPQSHTIEEVIFSFIPLDNDMIQEFKTDNAPYDDMLVYAAKRGVSIGRDRVFEDEEMSLELDDMWELEQFSECEPTLIHQVGLVVCEISGLTEFIENKKLEEETAPDDEIEVGDHIVPSDTELANMTPEQMAQHHKDNAVAA